jgi:hypothetical protein
MGVPTNYAPGRLPLFWDRSVIFFANLRALFYGNEAATRELSARVGEIETYGGRLCPLIDLLFRGGGNLLVLECEPDRILLQYFSTELGLTIPEYLILQHQHYRQLPDRLGGEAGRKVGQAPRDQPDSLGIRGVRSEPVPFSPSRGEPAREMGQEAGQRIARHPAPWIDGFVTDEVLMSVAGALGKRTLVSPESSRCGNNKLLVHRFLQQSGFPVFDTETAESPRDILDAAAAMGANGYQRIVVKAQIGASGIGMMMLDAERPAIETVPEHLFFEGPCLVQGWLDEHVAGVRRLGSPSMQLFLDETTVNLYDVTEQILSAESVHQGNIAPPPYWQAMRDIEPPMREQSEAVGQWLHDNGYRGTASADFLIVQRDGRLEVRLCEVNARVTGATYPSVLARRLSPGGVWLMRNLSFNPPIASGDLLDVLRRAGHLFAAGKSRGVLPINFNADRSGRIRKGQFLCLGAEENECFEDLMQSADILPVQWTYDRD